VRADYTPEERTNINRYKLGGQTIYNSRAAQKYAENAGAHLDRTQEGTVGNRVIGLARGAASMALAKMQLNITIASLGRGHHIECKDMEELLESEDTIRTSCKNLTRYLEVADTFNGSEIVVEYVNGEERVHVDQDATPLLEYSATAAQPATTDDCAYEPSSPAFEVEAVGKWVRRLWDNLGQSGKAERYLFVGLVVFVLIVLLRACLG
jgi:hypothetical protein